MKRILVPTDFSKNAYSALFYVSKLFSEEALHITIVHSFSEEISRLTSRVDIGRSEIIIDKLYHQSDDDGKLLLEKIKQDSVKQKHIYELISTPASLPNTINKLVSTDGIDLVVMGGKGRTAAEDVLIGSTTVKITKSLEGCPLLIVPSQVGFVIPLHIGFASDYNEFYQLSKLKPITRLVRQYNSQLHIINVGAESSLEENQKQNFEKFKNDLTEYDTEFHFIPKKGNVSKTLHAFIDEQNIDLFTLIYHRHAFIKQLFREPVVSRVGKHAHVPTLVIPTKY